MSEVLSNKFVTDSSSVKIVGRYEGPPLTPWNVVYEEDEAKSEPAPPPAKDQHEPLG